MKKAYEKAIEKYLPRDNVTGVAVGRKLKNGQWTDEICISIRVKEKKPLSELKKKDVLPKTILGIKTDVLEHSYKPLTQYNRLDPLQGGVSIGREGARTAGTLGCIVFKDDEPHILTNFHVVVPSGYSSLNEYMMQPSGVDGGSLVADRIGTIIDHSIGTDGDFAIIKIDLNLRQYSQDIFATGDIISNIKDPEIGDLVTKSGRTTDVTHGVVSAFGSFGVDYSAWGLGTIYIVGFEVVPLSDPYENISASGDSGSCVYITDSQTAVGILTAGSTSGPEIMLCCYITTAFSKFDLSIETEPLNAPQSVFGIPWLPSDEEYTQTVTLTFKKDYEAISLYTDPQFSRVIAAKFTSETDYCEVGAYSQTPLCILGDVQGNVAVSIDFKIQADTGLTGRQTIPIYVTYGNNANTGLNVDDIFWRNPDSMVMGWADTAEEADWLMWRH